MWGGLKRRADYGDVFRRWSATKPLEDVRQGLFKEPRPWFLLWSLHEHRHHLSDHHGSRLLSWCTTATQLAKNEKEKQQAYRYAQEAFRIFSNHHHVGESCLLEYMRLCAVGKDLTAAYNAYQNLVVEAASSSRLSRSGKDEYRSNCASINAPFSSSKCSTVTLLHLAWLARLATISPSDDKAEDMAIGVVELYTQHFGLLPCDSSIINCNNATIKSLEMYELWPSFTAAEQSHMKYLCCCLVSLAPRVQEETFRSKLESIPLTLNEAQRHLRNCGWPSIAHHHSFPCLEGGIIELDTDHLEDYKNDKSLSPHCFFSVLPRLQDSLLHPEWVKKLEVAAFCNQNVHEVSKLIQRIQQLIEEEKRSSKNGVPLLHSAPFSQGPLLWRQLHDPSAVLYRKKIVENGANSITPELYHYLIAALTHSKPTAALRTLDRMQQAKLRILDLTRAYLILHVQDSPDIQAKLFADQLKEIDFRERLDEDHGINAHLEAYWKYDYVTFFHYQNKLSRENFLWYLMKGIGLRATQALLLNYYYPSSSLQNKEKVVDAGSQGEKMDYELQADLVVLDADLRRATYRFLSQVFGESSVQTCLDDVTAVMPQLDISLIGSEIPHFEQYALPPPSKATRKEIVNDGQEHEGEPHDANTIATDIAALGRLLAPYDHIYVIDASFLETSEAFLGLAKTPPATRVGNYNPGIHTTAEKNGKPKSLVLIPYLSLRQLAESATQTDHFVSFDPALQQDIREESNLALQRLHSLFCMISNPRPNKMLSDNEFVNLPFYNSTVRIFHFTECFLSHVLLPPSSCDSFGFGSNREENNRMLLILSLLRTVAASQTRLVLCSDDENLNKSLESLSLHKNPGSNPNRTSTFGGPTTSYEQTKLKKKNNIKYVEDHLPPMLLKFNGRVDVLSTSQPPKAEVGESEAQELSHKNFWVNDNPTLEVDMNNFHPVLRGPVWLQKEDKNGTTHTGTCGERQESFTVVGQDNSSHSEALENIQADNHSNDGEWSKERRTSVCQKVQPEDVFGHCPSNFASLLSTSSTETISPWLRLLEEEEGTGVMDNAEVRNELEPLDDSPHTVGKSSGRSFLSKVDSAATSEAFGDKDARTALTDSRNENGEEEPIISTIPLTKSNTQVTDSFSSSSFPARIVEEPSSLSEDSSFTMKEQTTEKRVKLPLTTEGVGIQDEEESRGTDALWGLYPSVDDVVPLGAKIEEASHVDTLFHEFGVLEPTEKDELMAQKAADMSPLTSVSHNEADGKKGAGKNINKRWAISLLMKEKKMNRGFSVRDRARLARKLSNQSGGKVPFNLRYRVVEANINDPRNAHLVALYQKGVERKRVEFRRRKHC